ncbi:hypothetical protein [Halalkalibacillus halophilus]|uniref:hypothetical protein n=1 Tax=Halalkalibacillus halophilus TaxID=392827 RepID=UPI0003FBAD6F|nr:hypothetical protein [Halalkalibacillus halophilus]
MKITPGQKRLAIIWIAFLVVIAVALYYFILLEQQRSITTMENDLDFEMQKNTALQENLQNKDFDGLSADSYRELLPTELDDEQVMELINQASDDTNTTVQTYQYLERGQTSVDRLNQPVEEEEEEQNGDLSTLTLMLNGQTDSVSSLESFVDQMESSDRIVYIQSLQFESQQSEDVTFELTFSVFAY